MFENVFPKLFFEKKLINSYVRSTCDENSSSISRVLFLILSNRIDLKRKKGMRMLKI